MSRCDLYFVSNIFKGDVITHKTPHQYKQAVAYMLAQDYGYTRIMSSYYFDDTEQGPPHNGDFT